MLKYKKIIFISCLFLICAGLFIFLAEPIFAVTLRNPLGTTNIPSLVGNIIKALLGIVGSIALLMFIYGGFTWLTATGNPDKVKKGRDILVWATIGIVVIFVSYAAIDFVIGSLTGVTGGETASEESKIKGLPEDIGEWCGEHPEDERCDGE